MECITLDVQWKCHQFLYISEVCLLQRVSSTLQARIRRSLERYPWDAIRRKEKTKWRTWSPPDHLRGDHGEIPWLTGLHAANVNIRTLSLEDPIATLARAATRNSPNSVELIVRLFPRIDVNAHRRSRPWRWERRSPDRQTIGWCRTGTTGYEPIYECTALHRAARCGHAEVVNTLLDVASADINAVDSVGRTALHVAACFGRLTVVDTLLRKTSKGIDVNARGNDARTALHWACEKGHAKVVDALLSARGIRVNAVNARVMTAFHIACHAGHAEVVSLLLHVADRHNIDVNAKDKRGFFPLYSAVRAGYMNVTKLLLSAKGIDVNAVTRDGVTALHIASRSGHVELVKVLLDVKDIEVNALDCKHHTALSNAYELAEQSDIIEMLRAAGGIIDAEREREPEHERSGK